jgi:hypothetical protein
MVPLFPRLCSVCAASVSGIANAARRKVELDNLYVLAFMYYPLACVRRPTVK